jgi:hypothetical protein
MSRLARKVIWELGAGAWTASVDGERWELRAADAGYQLFVDGAFAETVAAWPDAWTRDPDDDPSQKREMELEQEQLERARRIKPSKLV